MKKSVAILAIVILGGFITSFTGSREISGTVSGKDGLPIPGVNIVVKGTSSGTVSDLNGNYKLTVGDNAKVLVFSFIGFDEVQEMIGTRNVINVVLKESEAKLDEVVVVAYGVSRHSRSKSVHALSAAAVGSYDKKEFQRFNNNFNTEGYASVNENGFKLVKSNPLSTFSIDVDNASYSNIRRFINSGQMPPADAVRIEEMINYFKYNYPEPVGEHPFSVSTEMAVCPWNKNHNLLQIGLHGKSIDKESLPPSNLVFSH